MPRCGGRWCNGGCRAATLEVGRPAAVRKGVCGKIARLLANTPQIGRKIGTFLVKSPAFLGKKQPIGRKFAKSRDRQPAQLQCRSVWSVISAGCACRSRRRPVDNLAGLLDPSRHLSIGVAQLRDRRSSGVDRSRAVFWTVDRAGRCSAGRRKAPGVARCLSPPVRPVRGPPQP